VPEVGIRELKASASEIVRAVREERAEYIITHRGKPVAMIVPFEEAAQEKESAIRTWWAELDEIGRQMEEDAPEAKSALQQLFEDREDS
jgi:prevent-host-death family protein